jgi:hypothetical protein
MKPNSTLIFILSLAISSLPLTGCAAVFLGGAAGAGGMAYLQGALETRVAHPYEQSVNATVAALESLQFKGVSESRDALQAKITARDAVDRLIQVSVKRESDSQTFLSIRVGTFGDERTSAVIFEEIKKRLKS